MCDVEIISIKCVIRRCILLLDKLLQKLRQILNRIEFDAIINKIIIKITLEIFSLNHIHL